MYGPRLPRPFIAVLALTAVFAAACASSRGTTATTTIGDPGAREVSQSAGEANGVVVLWPRIIPATAVPDTRDLAGAIQNHLKSLVSQALPGRAIDVRPEPERVCPQGGCRGISVGVLILRDQEGCSVLALVSGPGKAEMRIIPWVADVQLHQLSVPFRQPPEDAVEVRDFIPCDAMLGHLADRDIDVVSAIRAVAG